MKNLSLKQEFPVSKHPTSKSRQCVTIAQLLTMILKMSILSLLLIVTEKEGNAAELVQTSSTFVINCTSLGQLCTPPFSTTVQTIGLLQVQYTAPASHCSLVSIHIFVDGTPKVMAGAIAPLGTTGLLDLGPVSPGSHSLEVQGEGIVGGCNFGQLVSWGGTLVVFTSASEPPIANAGSDQTLALGRLVILDGSGSFDPDNAPQPLHFAWTQTAGPVVTLTGATTATPSFIPSKVGQYVFRLIVNDGQDNSVPDDVTITVECGVPSGGLVPPSIGIPLPDQCPPVFGFFTCKERRNFAGDSRQDCLLHRIESNSDERLELWCITRTSDFFTDSSTYELYYFGPKASGQAGACPWPRGENGGKLYYGGNRDGDKPDCFIRTVWRSIDGGRDEDNDGFVDWVDFIYDVPGNKLSVVNWESTDGPGDAPDLPARTPLLPDLDPPLGPETEAYFDALISILESSPPENQPMTADTSLACDLDRDGDCDGADAVTLNQAIGACRGDLAYNAVADFDSDGCVTSTDRQYLSGIVQIDIKPGSFPNSINPRSKGVIPVAILTTDTFDAVTVDPLSVKFGPNGATEAHSRGHIEDVDSDGDNDLVLHFHTQNTGIMCGNLLASLTAETFSGQMIEGSDSINTVGCK